MQDLGLTCMQSLQLELDITETNGAHLKPSGNYMYHLF
jgi:hypothetical protein